eukprot:8252884-Karenia_brevis.AAC.1
MEVTTITGIELQRLLARMSSSASKGVDGWAVDELKQLPLPVLELLADLLNQIQDSGRWQGALERALVTMIGKGEGQAPSAMRPITVMSVIYRLWALRRLQDMKSWQEAWAPASMHGFRPGHSPED